MLTCVGPAATMRRSGFSSRRPGDAQRSVSDVELSISAVLHLILAVVPEAERVPAAGSPRVSEPGGSIIVFDNFLKRSQPALRRPQTR